MPPAEPIAVARPASPHDAERLALVHAASGSGAESWDVDRCRALIEDPGTRRAGTWIIERSGEALGFAHFRDAADADPAETHGEIALLRLLEEAWGSGAARMLLDAVLDDMRVVGLAVATVRVPADDPRAHRFLERAGFVPDDRGPAGVRHRLAL